MIKIVISKRKGDRWCAVVKDTSKPKGFKILEMVNGKSAKDIFVRLTKRLSDA